MRIISGSFKGKKILQPIDKLTRPLRDMVKESIFNLLQHSNKINLNIEKSNVLDLFSGSGSFGLECISRGAIDVTFVENYPKAINILKKNINKLNLEKRSKIINENCFEYFSSNKKTYDKYDLIFIDPPYREKNINLILETIREKKILNDNGLVIIHRHKKDKINITDKLKIIDQRLYGVSKIIIGRLSFG